MNKLSRLFATQKKRQRAKRRLRTEQLECRMLLAGDFIYSMSTNPFDSEDVNGDGVISPVDALAVINALGDSENVAHGEGATPSGQTELAVDVNGDGYLSPVDALKVINELTPEGEHGGADLSYSPITLAPNIVGPFRFGADFNDNGASGDTIVRTDGGSWIDDGFTAGGQILIANSGEYLDVDQQRSIFTYSNPQTGTHPVSGATVTDPSNGSPVLAFTDTNSNSQYDYPVPVAVDNDSEIPGNDAIEFQGGEPISLGDFSADQHFHNNGLFTIASVTADTITFDSTVQLYDMSGNSSDVSAIFARPITSVGTGGDFVLGVVAEDLRPPALVTVGAQQVTIDGETFDVLQARGPFAVYGDVVFDDALVSPTAPNPNLGNVTFHNSLTDFSNGDFSTPGLVNEIGAAAAGTPGNSPVGSREVLAWTIPFTAGSSTGTAVFGSNPADILPNHDSLLFGINEAIDPDTLINFGSVSLEIVSDIVARDDLANGQPIATVDEGTGEIKVDVLSNDSVLVPQNGSATITAVTQPQTGTGSAVFRDNMVFFTPPSSVAAPVDATFTYTISNGQGATGTATVTVRVNPVNDPPVNTVPGAQAINEDNDLVFPSGSFSVTDADGNVNVTVDLASTLGTVSVPTTTGVTINNSGTSLVSLEGLVNDVNNALNSITYSPNSNANGSASLAVTTSDGIESDADTVNITINPINDPPVNTVPGPQTVFNTSTLSFTNNEFQVSDVDASTLEVTLTVTQGTVGVTTTTGLNLSGNNTASLTASGSISNLNNALNSLLYDPTDDVIDNGETLTLTTSDLGATGSGGTLTDTDVVSISITPPVTPFAAGNSYNADEGTAAFVLSPNPLGNDIVFMGGTLSVTNVDTVSAQGSLAFDGTDFTYTPPSDVNFFGAETFTYTIEDTTTPLGDDNDGPSTGTITIDVQPVNDAPVNSIGGSPIATAPSVSGTEDTALSFLGGNALSVSDIDAGTGSVTVTLTVNSGALNVSSTSGVQGNSSSQLTIDGTVSSVNNTLGGLTYTPNLNFYGNDSLTFNTNDNGNTGTSALSDNDTVNITISPVNDAPTLVVPGAQTFFTDFDNRFSSDPAPFSISDVDADTDDVQLDLTIGDGTLTLTSMTGVTVTQNPGGSNGIRLTGSVSNINNALASGVDYRTTVDGNKTLSATVSDLANNGSGGAMTASGSVAIEVLDFIPVDLNSEIFTDMDGDNTKDTGEIGVGGVDVVLTGTNFRGESVSMTTTTRGDGTFNFDDLQPNQPGQPYVVTQSLPAFFQANGSTLSLDINLQGQAQVTGGLSTGNLKDEFADIWSRFVFGGGAGTADKVSGVVFGIENGVTSFSSVVGSGWSMGQFSNFRFAPNSDGNSGVLTVFDSTAGVDRTANVSVTEGTLSHHGVGTNRIYRVVGGSSLLSAVPQPQAEGESKDDGPAETVDSGFAAAADDIFSRFS